MRRAAVLLALIASPAAGQLFADPHDAVAKYLRDVAGGDVDGDGARDLVSASSTSAGFGSSFAQVWLNDGSGALLAGETRGLLAGARAVSVVDCDLDGALDVLVSAEGDSPLFIGGVAVLLGDGAGSFPTGTTKFVNGAPSGHAVADVDGDGVLDLALALPKTAQVAVLLGTGSGGFGAPALLAAGPKPVAVALADLQRDGEVDLVVANGSGATVSVKLGAPGGFGPTSAWATGPVGTAVLAVNLDDDEFPDVVTANAGDSTLSVLLGDGAGGLLPAVNHASLASPSALEAADTDLDGDLDVVAAHQGGSWGGSVLRNDGAGGLSSPVALVIGASATGLDVGDLDGDVLPDVALACNGTTIEVRRGDGLGGFVDIVFVPAGSDPGGVCLADLDGGRTLDVAVANFGLDTATALAGDGLGALGAAASLPLGFDGGPNDVVAVDVTGDGAVDLVTADTKTDDVAVLAGSGGGFLAPVRTNCGDEPRALGAADVDGDGDADVVTCNTSGNTVAVLRASGGGLLAAVATAVGSHPTALALGHVDAGGTADAVTANEFAGTYTLLRGNGAGGWLPAVTLTGDGLVRGMALADVDDDGDDDLVSAYGATIASGQVAVRLSNGAGAFAAKTTTAIVLSPYDVAVADLDLDGALDVAVGHSGSPFSEERQVSVLRGNGAGGLMAPEQHLAGVAINSLAAGDMDADGAPDLVVASGALGRVAILRNLSLGPAWTPLGSALPGDFAPKLAGAGTLLAGSPGSLTLLDAPPLAIAALFFAPSSMPTPFKGGTLVPVPPAVTTTLVVPPGGLFKLAWTSFPPVGSGSSFWFQAATVDAGAPAGVALTGALKAVVP